MNNILFDLLEDSQFVDIMNNDVIEEGEQADAYKARKEKEKKEAEDKDEAQYQKRYGEKLTTSTLRGDDHKPGTNNVYKNKSPNGEHVKNTKNLTPQQKYNHAEKYRNDSIKASIDVAKERNRREFERDWGGTDNEKNLNTWGQVSRAADAKARHDRRHPNKESYLGINIE